MKKSPNLLLTAFCLLLTTYCLLLPTSPTLAQPKDLTINAQNISYDQEKKLYEAEGSVEVIYKDIRLTAKHIIYYTDQDRVYADQGFNLSYNGIDLQGETVDFGLKNKEGQASNFNFFYKGNRLSGKTMEMEKEHFQLHQAKFSTCDLAVPHYQVTALEITLYPKYGWLVAYWGFFWLQNLPLVPVPTYIYDLLAEERGQQNLPPFPEIGSDDDYGVYINERLAWHLKREFSGTYSLSYLSKKGLGGGATANYIINDDHQGDFRLYGNATDGLYGGITHHYTFGAEVKAEEKPFAFLVLPKYRNYELETSLSSRERINYQRISFLPNWILKLRKGELVQKEIKTDAELYLGIVREEKNTELGRGGGKAKLTYDLPPTFLGEVLPTFTLDTLFYTNGGKWIKFLSGLDLQNKFFENWSLNFGYRHYFLTSGQSSFNYEMYRFSPLDRFTTKFSFVHGETGIDLSAAYYLPSWQPEDIDYSLFFRLHCYNLITTYRSLRREFSLGVSLVTR